MFPYYFLEENDKRISSDFPFNIYRDRVAADVPSHGHNFLEIHYVLDGYGKESINGREYDMKPGTFAVILPNQVHEMRLQPGQTVLLYNFGISMKIFFEATAPDLSLYHMFFSLELNRTSLLQLEGGMAEKVSALFAEMEEEFSQQAVWHRLLFRAKFIELMVTFDRYHRDTLHPADTVAIAPKGNDIWSIIHYVYHNYREDMDLKRLSKKFSLSAAYISSSFYKNLGIHFSDFLTHIRIEHACGLLTSNRMPVSQIVYEAGFTSYPTFARVFRRSRGMSPSEYRKKASCAN